MTLFRVAHVDSFLPHLETVQAAQAHLAAKSATA
jgi:hypothetical protein